VDIVGCSNQSSRGGGGISKVVEVLGGLAVVNLSFGGIREQKIKNTMYTGLKLRLREILVTVVTCN
jgi:hypothetical protein